MVLLCAAAQSALAAEVATQELTELLVATESYAASFEQTVYGAQGQVLEQATGLVRLAGAKFRWEVVHPYPQIVVADEAYLRVYDPDLAQVTLRPVAEALVDTPIGLLTQRGDILERRYHVSRLDAEVGAEFVLEPIEPESLYAEVRVAFAASRLVRLSIVDHLGQITTIEFQPDSDAVLQSDDFTLNLPPGTDVIGG